MYEKLQVRIESTGFSSVTGFIVFVMRSLGSSGKIKEEDKLTEKGEEATFSEEEEEEGKRRLRALGYLE